MGQSMHSRQSEPSAAGWADAFVWGVWLAMVVAAVWLVATYGSEIPWADDWSFHVPQVSGERPADREWLLGRFGEFPTPLSKYLLYRLSIWLGFHGELYVHVVILAGLSAALILTSRRLRGRMSFADAFFPLALLHFGSDNFIWQSQLVNFLPSVLACALLMMLVCWGVRLPPVAGVGAGLTLLGLALSGPAGLVYVPAMSLCLLLAAAQYWRWPVGGPARFTITGLLVVGLILAANQFFGYCLFESLKPLPDQFREAAEWKDALSAGLQFLSVSFGHVSEHYWRVYALALVALIVATVGALMRGWRRQPDDRGRLFGLLIFVASSVLLVVATGRARGAFPEPKGLQAHYIPHVVTIPIAAYFILGKYGPAAVGRLAQWGLMLILLALLPLNTQQGLKMARDRIGKGSAAFERDLLAGYPPTVLAERHSRFFFDLRPEEYPHWEDMLATSIRKLHRGGIGVFSKLSDPAFREVHLPIDPIEIHDASWQDGILRVNGPDSFVTFALPGAPFVYGIRLRYSYIDPSRSTSEVTPVSFRAAWKHGDQSFSDSARTERIELAPDPQTWGPTWLGKGALTVWVNDRIDRFRIYPNDKGCGFHLMEMVALLPMADWQPGTRLDLTKPAAEVYLGDGWHDADGEARATEAKADISFRLETPDALRLRMSAFGFGSQRVVIRFNGQDVADRVLGATPEVMEVDIPAEIVSDRNTVTLVVPGARSPRSLGASDDERVLGIGVSWLELLPTAGPR
jgi:hypothetical protein